MVRSAARGASRIMGRALSRHQAIHDCPRQSETHNIAVVHGVLRLDVTADGLRIPTGCACPDCVAQEGAMKPHSPPASAWTRSRPPLLRFLDTCLNEFSAETSGAVADYIPELGKADPASFGIS